MIPTPTLARNAPCRAWARHRRADDSTGAECSTAAAWRPGDSVPAPRAWDSLGVGADGSVLGVGGQCGGLARHAVSGHLRQAPPPTPAAVGLLFRGLRLRESPRVRC